MADKEPNFIEDIIDAGLAVNKNDGRVATRFPPEPNGYLHIGHAKSICLNFGIAQKYRGTCNLRFDDTNPTKEEVEYVEGIERDVRWLGFDWGQRLYFASDYFDRMYQFAVELIRRGHAYICSLDEDQMRGHRGTLTEAGRNSPYRDRPVNESLDLFERMRKGEFPDGAYVLRAKIDMASPNINMRDPIIYRIRHEYHHRTKDRWCIYPMYDFAHCLSDSIEGITHSICTLEFENHRPLYDWILDKLEVECHPQQIEFARLNVSNTVMSKRKLQELVRGGSISGWDDPRMPTIAGLRRRGYTPEAIRSFCDRIGVSKVESLIDMTLLEHFIREDLNMRAQRVMVVLDPIKVVIDNYPEGMVEEFDAENNPEDKGAGTRKAPFSKEIYIEREDFKEDPPKHYFRLSPGKEVRLKHAYYIRCEKVVKDDKGDIVQVHCTYDPDSKGGWAKDGRKVQGTLHWVSGRHAVSAEARLYDILMNIADPAKIPEGADFKEYLNPASLKVMKNCKAEPSLVGAKPGARFQFLRQGYFCVDDDSSGDRMIFNRIVSLKDSWAKIEGSKRYPEAR